MPPERLRKASLTRAIAKTFKKIPCRITAGETRNTSEEEAKPAKTRAELFADNDDYWGRHAQLRAAARLDPNWEQVCDLWTRKAVQRA
jgi:hypothetical protein